MPRVRTDEGKPRYGGVKEPERGALGRYHSTSITERLPLTDLNRKAVNRKESTTGPNRKKSTLYPTNRPSRQLSQWETVITLNSCFSPMGRTFKTTPQDFPLLHKIVFLSSACWTFLWFCCSFYAPNGSLQFPNKPIFCWQDDCCFIFKVNNWNIRLLSFQITQNIEGPGIKIKYPIRRYT